VPAAAAATTASAAAARPLPPPVLRVPFASFPAVEDGRRLVRMVVRGAVPLVETELLLGVRFPRNEGPLARESRFAE
jgi:hypothetical protein